MSSTKRGWVAVAAAAVMLGGSQLIPATALAEPVDPADPAITPTQADVPPAELLHNIVYRARVDGVSRGATITYAAEDQRIQTASPTMVPGRTFEVNTVLPASDRANMRISIDWPYSANLHCEILVDNAVVAQADDFIGPRFMPAKDDPDYGALTCEAPVSPVAMPTDPAAAPADGTVPVEGAPPAPDVLPAPAVPPAA